MEAGSRRLSRRALAHGHWRHRLHLVAVHPWDIHGAADAGLETAWITRDEAAEYASHFRRPTTTAHSIPHLAESLRLNTSGVAPN